jgi:dTDP-D-glucose 4,6-dehydratase
LLPTETVTVAHAVYSKEEILKQTIQSDQKEKKSEQALQIINHVVAESYANDRSIRGRRQFVVSNATL